MDEADLVGELEPQERRAQQRGATVLVELAGRGEPEVGLEGLGQAQGGPGLLDRDGLAEGLTEARVSHTHVTAYIKAEGSRLTELAAQARMTLPAMSETVDDLQRLGIVERRPDPRDRRAKLICLADAGWEAMRIARDVIAGIERDWSQRVGPDRFEAAAQTLDDLLRALSADADRGSG